MTDTKHPTLLSTKIEFGNRVHDVSVTFVAPPSGIVQIRAQEYIDHAVLEVWEVPE